MFDVISQAGIPWEDLKSAWDSIQSSFREFGITKTLFVLFFFAAHWYVRRLYMQNIQNKQSEIDRIAEDHRRLREENKELRDELRQTYRQLGSTKKK